MKPFVLQPRPASVFKIYLPAVIPFVLGLIADIGLHFLTSALPLLLVKASIGIVLFLAGCLTSLFILVYTRSRQVSEKRARRMVDETQLAQDETRRRFFRRLDHEVKNPLTAMRAALANFPESPSTPEQLRVIQDVQRQVDRLSRLASDLRKLAELEERPLEKLPVDLGALLEEVVETVQSHPTYASRNIHLVVPKVPWPLSPIIGDHDLLGLAFYNLVDNALKFTGQENPIEIRAMEDGRSALVEVADTGAGIPEDDVPRIFEELYRGANARGFEGSGLGLALVQRVIARHGGTVSVRSRSGKGSVFTVRLPS